MVGDDYTNKEDVAIDKAIEFNNHNDDDDDDDANKDDDNDYDLYSKVATIKKRKKGVMPKQTMPRQSPWQQPNTTKKPEKQ